MTRGVAGAKQGKLAFFIGGDPVDVDKAKTVLQATGDTFVQFGSRIVTREYDPPRVTVDHACDDMVLAQGLAATAAAPVFMLAAAQELYRFSSASGHGEGDVSILGEFWRIGGNV